MRNIVTVTKHTVYSYEELSENAQNAVKEWYLEGQCDLYYLFTEDCEEELKQLFPNSELKVQYSLNYCQGDGINIYGEIHLDELLEKFCNSFTEKERKFFNWIFSEYGTSYQMNPNKFYNYCICSQNNFSEDMDWWMESNYMRNIPKNTLEKFNQLAGEFLDSLCGNLEKKGYDFFYEVDDEELEDICRCNELEFTADGKIFFT